MNSALQGGWGRIRFWVHWAPARGGPAISFVISLELSKLLSLLVYPLSQALLLAALALLALWLGRRRLAGCTLLLAVAWLYLCSTAWFADYLAATLEDDYPPTALSVIPAVDAIVVLGGAVRGDTHLGTLGDLNESADRLLHAALLYRAGKAPRVLLSGGGAPGVRPEAELMAELLEVMGVPRRAMLLEDRSRTTYDNALYSAVLLNQEGARRILLVTTATHMRRAEGLFTAQGLEVVPAPTDYQRLVAPEAATLPPWAPEVGNLQRSTRALHEWAGYWVYRQRGWL